MDINDEFSRGVSSVKALRDNYFKLKHDGHTDEAHELLLRALDLYPNDPDLLTDMGFSHKHQGNIPQAMKHFGLAFKQRPNDIKNAMNYAHSLVDIKMFHEAEIVYIKVLQDNLNDVRLLTAMGDLYCYTDKLGLATICYGRAAKQPDADYKAIDRYEKIKPRSHIEYSKGRWTDFMRRAEKKLEEAIDEDFANAEYSHS